MSRPDSEAEGRAEGHASDQGGEGQPAYQREELLQALDDLSRTTRELDVKISAARGETQTVMESLLASSGAAGGTADTAIARREGRTSVAKVTVNLPEDMAESLRDLARREDKTFTQALKEAITLKLFVSDVIEQGAKLLIEHRDKTIERIVFGLSPPPRR